MKKKIIITMPLHNETNDCLVHVYMFQLFIMYCAIKMQSE